MLADTSPTVDYTGALSSDVHLPATSLYELIDFIGEGLPNWRDDKERKPQTSENSLTSQLCSYLNTVSRRSKGWDFLQFKTEEPDETVVGRKIDLVAAPCDAVVWIEGRRHVQYDTLLPIECKRFPTPTGTGRDEREYVINQHSTTGGIQRFKAGHHGANYKLGGMIAYVQQESRSFWDLRVAEWINGLVKDGHAGWTKEDLLTLDRHNDTIKLSVLKSSHTREKGLPDIELHHLWLEMN